jgi:hypothetical protein
MWSVSASCQTDHQNDHGAVRRRRALLDTAGVRSSAVTSGHAPLSSVEGLMSVNVTLALAVTGLVDEAAAAAAEAAVLGVLLAESIEDDVVLERSPGSLTGHTPYPLIISGFYRWHDGFEAQLRAAVANAAPAASLTLTWGYPDGP